MLYLSIVEDKLVVHLASMRCHVLEYCRCADVKYDLHINGFVHVF